MRRKSIYIDPPVVRYRVKFFTRLGRWLKNLFRKENEL